MKRVLLIGDQCEDVYHYGVCNRLSPEAPVVILDKSRQEVRPGMALNVYHNLLSLDLVVDKVISKKKLRKHRFVEEGYNKHLLRVDEEFGKANDKFDAKVLKKYIDIDGIVVSDYNKGFLTTADLQEICSYCNDLKIPVFMDTKKRDLSKLDNAIIKINKKEFSSLAGISSNLKVIITLGSKGAEFEGKIFPTDKVDMFDPCGAGDVFLAALVKHFLDTGDFEASIIFANKLASFSTTKMGTYIIKKEDLNDICF